MQNNDGDAEQREFRDWKKMPTTIGFRLDPEHKKALFKRASDLKMSVHDLARFYVVQMLHEADERQQIVGAIIALQQELVEARKDVAVSTQELLISAGRANLKQAKAWVTENLIPK